MLRIVLIALAAVSLSGCAKAKSPDKQAQAAVSTPTPEGKAFLDKTAKEPGVTVLPSGLMYKVVHSGPTTGIKPQAGDEVKVNYEGKLIDGKVFDSSYERGMPAAMPLDGLIAAWQEALPLMRPGDEWILYVPPQLAYGAEGGGDVIPPNATLIFRIELIDVLPRPGRIKQG
jgi:FKBP-type peptidyl-prolyl cis-trans isomerase